MAKRADPGDETMELSTSQLVPDAPPRRRMPPPQISPQDASVWKQVVVGSNDFAPPPKARSGRARTWAIAGVAAAAIAGGGAYAWHRLSSDGAPAEQAAASQPAVAKASEPKPAEQKPAEPKPAVPPAPAVAVETPTPTVEAPAPGDDEPPATWLTDLVASLSPPEAVTSLFAGLAPWTAVTTATTKPPPPATKKAPIAPKKPQLAPAAPKKPVPPGKRARR
jgi:hypothetical protein